MRKQVVGGILLVASFCLGGVPDAVVTTTNTYNGYATIAGRLSAKPEGPVGISVRNGNILYSTISDPQGRWGIVIWQSSTDLSVQSWDLKNPTDRGDLIMQPLK